MNRLAALALTLFIVGCSRSAVPPVAPQSQPVVPLILQTGTPPLQWAQIPTNEPTGSVITSTGRAPNGDMWFTEAFGPTGNFVGRVSMDRSVTEWPISGSDSIVAGPDGNMWFTSNAGQSGEVDSITQAGVITHYPQSGYAFNICNGPDGNLWYTTGQKNIVRLTTQGVATAFPVNGYIPRLCHKGADGRVWFSTESVVGAIDPTSGSVWLGNHGMPVIRTITAGPDGNIWVGFNYTFSIGNIAKIAPDGTTTVYPLGTGQIADGIVSGPNGNLWFAGNRGVGEMTTAGTLIAWRPDPLLPKGVALATISAGSDGNLWMGTAASNIGNYSVQYAAVDVFIYRVLTASPSPVILASGTSTTLTISERHYNNTFTVKSADPSIATVVNAGTRTTFTVTGIAHGTTTLTIGDKHQNSLVVTVTVS